MGLIFLRMLATVPAVLVTQSLAVDMTMFVLRNNYGMNVGAVRGNWFAAGIVLEILMAAVFWAAAIQVSTRQRIHESDQRPSK